MGKRFQVPGEWGPGGSDWDTFLEAVAEVAPQVLISLHEAVLPVFSAAVPQAPWLLKGRRTSVVPEELNEALLAWAKSYEISNAMVISAALATLRRWHSAGFVPRWNIPKQQWRLDRINPKLAPQAYTFEVRWSPLHPLDRARVQCEFAAWLDELTRSAETVAEEAAQTGELIASAGKRARRRKRSGVVIHDEHEHFRWAVTFRCLGHSQASIAESAGFNAQAVREAIKDIDQRLGLEPVNARARPRRYFGRNQRRE